MSRRTLYRVLQPDEVTRILRRIRIEQAPNGCSPAPRNDPITTACSFDSESGFYRSFKAATGLSPGAYRSHHETDTQMR
ncbi:hypothetical protein AVR91_0203670 [Amycolatopsis keratiniphila subsp. keratiniphila]|uniref:HTH araC/xylS-type domain-containing protein n=2 Tax=Amycolatopsis keratiniphila TaxID=129921 RepID=A0A1W2M2Z2_9PSEU|nr:hypothetical protein AVR91_0203670 [Amycolatopsis keratiniphila subsp. keratiniphila]